MAKHHLLRATSNVYNLESRSGTIVDTQTLPSTLPPPAAQDVAKALEPPVDPSDLVSEIFARSHSRRTSLLPSSRGASRSGTPAPSGGIPQRESPATSHIETPPSLDGMVRVENTSEQPEAKTQFENEVFEGV